jgi:hypothetical protein
MIISSGFRPFLVSSEFNLDASSAQIDLARRSTSFKNPVANPEKNQQQEESCT